MIRINLLPAELESAPAQALSPVIPLGAAVIIPILILVPLHLSKMTTRRKLESDSASLKSEVDRYQPIIQQVEALERAKVQLTQRKTVIQQLESERLRYPQFMDDFVKLLPGNMWLTNLTTVAQPNNALTVGMDVTALDNYAIADLVANLETSQIFTDVDLGAISTGQTQGGGESMTFHVNTTYKKLTPVPDASKKS
jgi:type IV pilus assembly protein PilN